MTDTTNPATRPDIVALMALADAYAFSALGQGMESARTALRTALIAAVSGNGGEDARDAGRYRTLREWPSNHIDQWGCMTPPEDRDADIDAAMSTNNLPGEGEKS